MDNFKGILPAVVTPFDTEGRFNSTVFEHLLERLYAAGVYGVYVCGSTGEGLLQSVAQREQIAEVAVKNSPPGKQVIIHVGAHATVDAIDLARHASRIGAHAISALPPPGSYNFAEVKEYYRAIAAASSIPLLIYYFPTASPAIMSAAQIIELCDLPNVVGLKFTDFDLFKMSCVKQSGAIVFNGYDEVLVAGLLMGADGGIGTFYNLVPELFVRLYQATRQQQWEAARVLQSRINGLITCTLRYPVFPAVKAMLKFSGLDCGVCLAPRRNLSPEEEAAICSRFLQFLSDEDWAPRVP